MQTTTNTRMLRTESGRIAYDVRGHGDLVVCIPAMGDLRRSFDAVADALAAAGHRVATFDLRGHGESDAEFARYDDEAAAHDALALIAELGGPAVLIGSSMGAGAAVIAAADHPAAVRSLVLVGPFVRNPPAGRIKTALMRLALSRPWGRLAWRSIVPSLYAGTKPADFAEHLAAIDAGLRRPEYWRAFAATTRLSHEPAERRLSALDLPVLVVMGELDPDFADPAAEAAFVAEATAGRAVMVPDAGHHPEAQRPDVVAPAILAFLAEGADA